MNCYRMTAGGTGDARPRTIQVRFGYARLRLGRKYEVSKRFLKGIVSDISSSLPSGRTRVRDSQTHMLASPAPFVSDCSCRRNFRGKLHGLPEASNMARGSLADPVGEAPRPAESRQPREGAEEDPDEPTVSQGADRTTSKLPRPFPRPIATIQPGQVCPCNTVLISSSSGPGSAH